MGEEIYLVKRENISEKKFLLLGEEARHCFKVKRNERDDLILLTDGEGKEYKGKINEVNPRANSVAGEVLEVREGSRELPVPIHLAFAPIKRRDLTFLIEKATELGVRGFIPIKTERSFLYFKKERFEKVAQRGMKTALGTFLPQFYPLINFDSLIALVKDYSLALLAYEKEEERFLFDIPWDRGEGKILLIVGPEGGFADWEVARAKKEGVLTFSLGKRRLATGTAALSALSIISECLRIKRRGGDEFG
ncbi:MAG: 16S rRNA (uracil(1498)-N(3))-methyltransferase [candidate division WOR-3 bacterium]